MKSKQKYVIFYGDDVSNAAVTDDPIKLYKSGDLDPENDVVYELGKKVIIHTELKLEPSEPVTRKPLGYESYD